jgi:hypothetical protein
MPVMSRSLSDYAASVGCTVTLPVQQTYYNLDQSFALVQHYLQTAGFFQAVILSDCQYGHQMGGRDDLLTSRQA